MKKRKKDYLNSINVRRVISITLLILWIMFIFRNSSETAAVSSVKSRAITAFLKNIVSEKFIRKMAHLIEYTILGFLLSFTSDSCIGRNKRGTIITLVAGAIIPAIDEMIQLTSAGRSAQFSDVCLDFSGVVLGFVVFSVGMLILIRKKIISNQ